jgi:hypothetical protein
VPNLDEFHIRTALLAARDVRRKNSKLRSTNRSEDPRTAVNEYWFLEKLLGSQSPDRGRHLDELDKIRSQHQAEIGRFLQKQKAAVVKHSSSIKDSQAHGVIGRRRAIERMTSSRNEALPAAANFNFVVLDTPLFVLPSRDINLVKTSLAPWNNLAKINAQWNTPYPDNGWDDLSFVFVWENPSIRDTVVNVESYLLLNGFCDVLAEGGPGKVIWGQKYTDLDISVGLNILEYWNNPPTVPSGQNGQYEYAVRLHAHGGGIFGLGDYESSGVNGSYDVLYRMFLIPPQGVAVFEVTLSIDHWTDGGFIDIDFAADDFDVMCPAVVMAILI